MIEFVNCKRSKQEPIAYEIIQSWRQSQNPPGRFLKMSNETGMWYDIGDEQGKNKTIRALQWKKRFLQLKSYRSKHGDCLVPLGCRLGVWIKYQRNQYKLVKEGNFAKIDQEQINLLKELEFCWTGLGDKQTKNSPTKRKNYSTAWDERCAVLRKYKIKYGDCLVPRDYSTDNQLAKWVAYQRYQYRLKREGKKSQITDERIESLNELDFAWSILPEKSKVGWEGRFKKLKKYKKRHGNCQVPKGYIENPRLGNWVNYQRQLHKRKIARKDSELTDKRLSLLDSIGFIWHVGRGNGNTVVGK